MNTYNIQNNFKTKKQKKAKQLKQTKTKKVKFNKKNNILIFNNKQPVLNISNIIKTKTLFNINKMNKNVFKTSNESFKNKFIFLNKNEIDIWYNKKLKYPIVVAEQLNETTGYTEKNKEIKRSDILDAFKPDEKIPKKYSHSIEDYNIYMEYGGSMGHNAPAGHHKTNLDVYKETFLLSNICPQEIVFNSGSWVLIENWCKRFTQVNENIKNMMVLTGSIPNQFNANKTFKSYVYKNKEIEMNIPKFMYKILLFTDPKNYPDHIFPICILVKNKPQYISNKLKNFDISRYITTLNNLSKLINLDITKIINYYKIKNNLHKDIDLMSFNYYKNNKKIYSSLKQNLIFYINPFLNTQMEKSYYYGKLIYSQSLEELNRYWKQVEQRKVKFNDISFHKQYYDLAYQRLTNNKNN